MQTIFEPEVEPARAPRSIRARVRRWMRRTVKASVMVGIVGTLSVSLVVTTPSNAQAFAPPIPVLPVVAAAEAVLGGGVAITMPSLLATSLAIHPVGWAIAGVAALGVGLWATKDYWLPYVTGDAGKGDNVQETGTEPGQVSPGESPPLPSLKTEGAGADASGNFMPGLRITAIRMNQGARSYVYQAAIDTQYTGSQVFEVPKDFAVAITLYCQAGDGTNYDAGASVTTNKSLGWVTAKTKNDTATSLDPERNGYASLTCPNSTDRIVGGLAGSGGAHSDLYTAAEIGADFKGPENLVTFGEVDTSKFKKAYDPRGVDTTYRSEVECVSDDGTLSTLTALSQGNAGGITMPSCAAAGKGHGTGAFKVFVLPPGGAPEELMMDQKAPVADPAQPLCDSTKPGSGCKLGVFLDGKPCVVGEWMCEHWSDVRNDPNSSTRLSCQYGPYSVPLSTCNPIERAYEPGGAPATEKNTDGDPSTRDDKQPDGTVQPKPGTNPGTGGNTGSFPTTGTNPGSNPGEDGQNCLGQGWSWNPVSWVMVPVQCAMQWAFVPQKVQLDAMQAQLQPKLEAKGINGFVGPFAAQFSGLNGSGCEGPPIDLSAIHLETIHPFSACTQPMSGIAAGVNGFMSLWLIVYGGMSCIRGVSSAFGFNWTLGSRTEEA